jgi:hypothetical protein
MTLIMSLNSTTTFRKGAIALSAAAAIAASSFFPANAQTTMAVNTPTSNVSAGDCAAFLHYVVDEAKAFPGRLSKGFLAGVLRFNRAGCLPSDANGSIQIVTETDQDAISFRTALTRMGKVDVLGLSGVAHCDRPATGICPTRTGNTIIPKNGG